MPTESETESCDACDEITKLKQNRDELIERDNALNERLCAVEECCAPDVFLPGTFAFAADTGLVNGDQALVANLILSWGLGADGCSVDGLFLGGDNNYPSGAAATMDANLAAFQSLRDKNLIFPAMGNHDIDTQEGLPLVEAFPTIFTEEDDPAVNGVKGYYHKYFERGDLDLFVLNDGMDSGYITSPAPPFDGNYVGSAQYQWFIEQLAVATGRWRVVMVHHPHVTPVDTGWPPRYLRNIDWSFESLGIHLMLVGHTHSNNHLRSNGLNVLDISKTVQAGRTIDTANFYGEDDGVYSVWQDLDGAGDTGLPAAAKIIAEAHRLSVEVYRADGGSLIHSFVV